MATDGTDESNTSTEDTAAETTTTTTDTNTTATTTATSVEKNDEETIETKEKQKATATTAAATTTATPATSVETKNEAMVVDGPKQEKIDADASNKTSTPEETAARATTTTIPAKNVETNKETIETTEEQEEEKEKKVDLEVNHNNVREQEKPKAIITATKGGEGEEVRETTAAASAPAAASVGKIETVVETKEQHEGEKRDVDLEKNDNNIETDDAGVSKYPPENTATATAATPAATSSVETKNNQSIAQVQAQEQERKKAAELEYTENNRRREKPRVRATGEGGAARFAANADHSNNDTRRMRPRKTDDPRAGKKTTTTASNMPARKKLRGGKTTPPKSAIKKRSIADVNKSPPAKRKQGDDDNTNAASGDDVAFGAAGSASKSLHEHYASQIVFFAVRPGGFVDRPVIFFGFKEFDLFQKGARDQAAKEEDDDDKDDSDDEDDQRFIYKVCDNLADALSYVAAKDPPPTTTTGNDANKRRRFDNNPMNNNFPRPFPQQRPMVPQNFAVRPPFLRPAIVPPNPVAIAQARAHAQRQAHAQAQRPIVPPHPVAVAQARAQQQAHVHARAQAQRPIVPPHPVAVAQTRAEAQRQQQIFVDEQQQMIRRSMAEMAAKAARLMGNNDNANNNNSVTTEESTVPTAAAAANDRSSEGNENSPNATTPTTQRGESAPMAVALTTTATDAPPKRKAPSLPITATWKRPLPSSRRLSPITRKRPARKSIRRQIARNYRDDSGSSSDDESLPGRATADRMKNSSKWNEKFELLRQYKEEFGDCHVPWNVEELSDKYTPLGNWLKSQRMYVKAFDEDRGLKNRMTAERKQRLLDLGVVTDIPLAKWEEKFRLLKQYKEENGDCELTRQSKDLADKYKALGRWLDTQRSNMKAYDKDPSSSNNKISAEQRQRLLDLGVVVATDTLKVNFHWEEKFDLFLQYKKEVGDSIAGELTRAVKGLPEKYKHLGGWLDIQRCLIRAYDEGPSSSSKTRGQISADQRQRLLDSGIIVDILGAKWDAKFELLCQYKEKFGECQLAQPDKMLPEKYKHLRHWLNKQRDRMKVFDTDPSVTTPLSAEQRQRLLDLGVITDCQSARWEEKFELLQQYKDEFGDDSGIITRTRTNDVPEKYKELGTWLSTQRQYIKAFEKDPSSNKITAEQRQRLLDLGVVVHVFDVIWERKFQLLQQYKEEFGDCDLSKYSENAPEKYKSLVAWLRIQRTRMKAFNEDPNTPNKISAEQRNRLLDLGVVVDILGAKWEEKFELLRQYKEEFGECDLAQPVRSMPSKYRPLGFWLRTQREHIMAFDKDPSSNKISAEQKQRLLDLGVVVDTSGVKWEERFALLREFKAETGHCRVPTQAKHSSLQEKYRPLSKWIAAQRAAMNAADEDPSKASAVAKERWQRLLDLGVAKTLIRGVPKEHRQKNFDIMFDRKIAELKAYKAEHGDVNVPASNIHLRRWLVKQRKNYDDLQQGKETFLKLEQILALSSLGFSMEHDFLPRKRFEDRILEYVEFVKTKGHHPDLKSKDPHESMLGETAHRFRGKRKLYSEGVMKTKKLGNTKIPDELIEALDSVGFRWKIKEIKNYPKKARPRISWETRFEQLKAYKAKHGHLEPPKRHPKLGSFAFQMRKQYKLMVEDKKSSLTMERFRLLSEIGFRFKTTEVGGSRKRYVNNDSSGYDTSDDDEDDDDEIDGGEAIVIPDESQPPYAPAHPDHEAGTAATARGRGQHDPDHAGVARLPNPLNDGLRWMGEKSPRFSQGFNNFY